MKTALTEVGVTEISGPRANLRIIEYLATTTYKSTKDETPWCSAFVNWVFEINKIAGTDSAAALSWLHWGKPTQVPVYGCVTVFDHGDGHGHVGFFTGGDLDILGGNQGNKVCIAHFTRHKLAGFRLPG